MSDIDVLDKIFEQNVQEARSSNQDTTQVKKNTPENPVPHPRVDKNTPMAVPPNIGKKSYIPIISQNTYDNMPVTRVHVATEMSSHQYPPRD